MFICLTYYYFIQIRSCSMQKRQQTNYNIYIIGIQKSIYEDIFQFDDSRAFLVMKEQIVQHVSLTRNTQFATLL